MKTKIISALIAASFLLGVPALSHASNANQCKDPKTHKFIKCTTSASSSSSSAATSSAAATGTKTQCRDAKGKFTKCPPAPTKPKQCRDPKTGKFIKCPA